MNCYIKTRLHLARSPKIFTIDPQSYCKICLSQSKEYVHKRGLSSETPVACLVYSIA